MTIKIGLVFFLLTAASAQSSSELDRQYLFETVGALKAYDNVDGLFADYVSNAYRETFLTQSRFIYQDLGRVDTALSKSKIPYLELIGDQKVLEQLSRSLRLQALIRTKIRKEGPTYRITMDWIHTPSIDLVASETFTLGNSQGDSQEISKIQTAISKGVDRLLAKIPFVGHVTGRDGNSVIVNIGSAQSLVPGDELILGTIDEAKRHPLLRAVVDWRISKTGRVIIEQVEEKISFCRIVDESNNRTIQRYQKVLEILPKPETPIKKPKTLRREFNENAPGDSEIGSDSIHSEGSSPTEETGPLDLPPHLGFITANLGIGSFSRTFGAPSTDNGGGRTGSSGIIGGKLEGQLWITGQVFGELTLGYGTGNYSQKLTSNNRDSPAAAVSSSVSQFKLGVGYNFFGAGQVKAAKGYVRGGYRTDSYTLPIDSTEQMGPTTFNALYAGIGGDLPIRGNIGLLLGVDFGLLSSASESGINSGNVTGASNLEVYFGGYYSLKPRLSIRLLINILNQSAEFGSSKSAAHKTFVLSPGLIYLF